MKLFFTVISLSLVLAITGCTTTSTPISPIEISTTPIDRPSLSIPKADTLRIREIDWKIITEENIEQIFQELKNNGKDPVLFAVTEDGYERLALNLGDVRTFIQQQRTIIASYERYYNDADNQLKIAQDQINVINAQIAERNAASVTSSSVIGVIN